MISEKAMMSLQNGSDVRGVATTGVADEPVTLFPEAANRIVAAFVKFLVKKTGKSAANLKIAVGHDSRISANSLREEALRGIVSEGAVAVDCGLASTPAMFMSIVFNETNMDGSIMITASHLPYNRNGLKFFTEDGGLEKSEITEVLKLAAKGRQQLVDITAVEKIDLIELYAKNLRRKICEGIKAADYAHPLKGMHIVVDAGNGAGGFFAAKVLDVLGADTSGSLFLDPDGYFPNHIPNPENQQAMDAIRGAVLRNKADLGIIFDTDVDRMSAVLPDGEQLNRNALIAMMAAILAPDYPGSTIITDSVTSDELATFIEKDLKLKHHRFKRGYKNVIDECKRLNEAGTVSPLAIETSGHGALSENYYLDDGAYLAVKMLIAAAKAKQNGRAFGDLIKTLGYPAESVEYRLRIKTEDFHTYGEKVLQVFTQRAETAGLKFVSPSYEGVRIVFANGWALLRMSLHDPNLPLNIEGKEVGECKKIAAQVKNLLRGFENLDLSAFDK